MSSGDEMMTHRGWTISQPTWLILRQAGRRSTGPADAKLLHFGKEGGALQPEASRRPLRPADHPPGLI
jgi:hypothetical protein